jgi:hypothetical protein
MVLLIVTLFIPLEEVDHNFDKSDFALHQKDYTNVNSNFTSSVVLEKIFIDFLNFTSSVVLEKIYKDFSNI